jgi:hypothetical protein
MQEWTGVNMHLRDGSRWKQKQGEHRRQWQEAVIIQGAAHTVDGQAIQYKKMMKSVAQSCRAWHVATKNNTGTKKNLPRKHCPGHSFIFIMDFGQTTMQTSASWVCVASVEAKVKTQSWCWLAIKRHNTTFSKILHEVQTFSQQRS